MPRIKIDKGLEIALGYNIRTIRESAKLTHRELSELMEVHYTVPYRWENGKSHMCLGNFIKFCGIFGISPNALLGWEFRK